MPSTNVYRDMLLWTGWTSGPVTTGGTVQGSLPNPLRTVSNLLTFNTTTGTLTIILPTLPAVVNGNYTGWAVKVEAVLECISPNTVPLKSLPVYLSMHPQNHLCTTYFEDADWGNFISYGGANVTAQTMLNGAYTAGTFDVQFFTGGVNFNNQYNTPLNSKIHLSVDMVAY